MKKIEVVAKFTETGKIIPQNFRIGKNSYRIHSSGRQWEDEKGKHFLVMDIYAKTHHLCFNAQECTWHLIGGSHAPAAPA